MANSKVRCKSCKSYVARDQVLTVRLGRFCSRACLLQEQAARQAKARTRAKKGSSGSEDYQAVIRRRDGCCRVCGDWRSTQVHHIVFRGQGGTDDPSNLILLCGSCHSAFAHGAEATRYRGLFSEYIRILAEERRKLTIREVAARGSSS